MTFHVKISDSLLFWFEAPVVSRPGDQNAFLVYTTRVTAVGNLSIPSVSVQSNSNAEVLTQAIISLIFFTARTIIFYYKSHNLIQISLNFYQKIGMSIKIMNNEKGKIVSLVYTKL